MGLAGVVVWWEWSSGFSRGVWFGGCGLVGVGSFRCLQ